MGTYEAARNRARNRIQESFWDLYESGVDRITVSDVCKKAGIARSSFYYHYNSTDEVLDSIKEKQMVLIRDLFDSSDNDGRDFVNFIPRFQELFAENRRYLIPLVMEYRDPEFARRYRDYVESMMLNDLRISDDGGSNVKEITSVLISGLTHMFLECLASNIITIEDANNLSNGMINTGLRWILKEKYGVSIGFTRMMERAPSEWV